MRKIIQQNSKAGTFLSSYGLYILTIFALLFFAYYNQGISKVIAAGFVILFVVLIAYKITSDSSSKDNANAQVQNDQTATNSNTIVKYVKPTSKDLPRFLPPKVYKEHIELFLDQQVVGQEMAKQLVSKALEKKTNRRVNELINMKDNPRSRVMSMLFVGQTGVGKTEMANAIGQYFSKYNFGYSRLDMNAYVGEHMASSLVGSPKGYIGSDDFGYLAKAVVKNTNHVILFDEIEKAHHLLYSPLLNLIDNGVIEEVSNGERYVLTYGIVIFTTNMFQESVRQIVERVPDEIESNLLIQELFSGEYKNVSQVVDKDLLEKEKLLFIQQGKDRLVPFLPPEFVGRITVFVPFFPLKDEELVTIISRKFEIDEKQALVLYNKYKRFAEKFGVRGVMKMIELEI